MITCDSSLAARPLTRAELADVLDDFATEVIELPGVSRLNPHLFAERKDALMRKIRAKANDLRGMPRAVGDVAAIAPGARRIRGRVIPVERRAGRA